MVPENSVCAVTKTGPKPVLIWDHNEEHIPSEWIFFGFHQWEPLGSSGGGAASY